MTRDEPFTGMIVLLFSWASWLDGSVWTSGVCAGVGGAMLAEFCLTWLNRRARDPQ